MERKSQNKIDSQRRLSVSLTKEQIDSSRLPGSIAVVIDVFLTGTTILHILELGAKQVIPLCSVNELESLKLPKEDLSGLLTAGESLGEKPESFDRGPYPTDFSDILVRGKIVAYLSTNGCQAISSAKDADEILIGCIRNAPAISNYLDGSCNKNVNLICSGSRGRASLEDFLAASIIVSRMNETGEKWKLDDLAILAREFGKDIDNQNIISLLKESRLGRQFVATGHLVDLEFAGALGASDRIPKMKDKVLVLL